MMQLEFTVVEFDMLYEHIRYPRSDVTPLAQTIRKLHAFYADLKNNEIVILTKRSEDGGEAMDTGTEGTAG